MAQKLRLTGKRNESFWVWSKEWLSYGTNCREKVNQWIKGRLSDWYMSACVQIKGCSQCRITERKTGGKPGNCTKKYGTLIRYFNCADLQENKFSHKMKKGKKRGARRFSVATISRKDSSGLWWYYIISMKEQKIILIIIN